MKYIVVLSTLLFCGAIIVAAEKSNEGMFRQKVKAPSPVFMEVMSVSNDLKGEHSLCTFTVEPPYEILQNILDNVVRGHAPETNCLMDLMNFRCVSRRFHNVICDFFHKIISTRGESLFFNFGLYENLSTLCNVIKLTPITSRSSEDDRCKEFFEKLQDSSPYLRSLKVDSTNNKITPEQKTNEVVIEYFENSSIMLCDGGKDKSGVQCVSAQFRTPLNWGSNVAQFVSIIDSNLFAMLTQRYNPQKVIIDIEFVMSALSDDLETMTRIAEGLILSFKKSANPFLLRSVTIPGLGADQKLPVMDLRAADNMKKKLFKEIMQRPLKQGDEILSRKDVVRMKRVLDYIVYVVDFCGHENYCIAFLENVSEFLGKVRNKIDREQEKVFDSFTSEIISYCVEKLSDNKIDSFLRWPIGNSRYYNLALYPTEQYISCNGERFDRSEEFFMRCETTLIKLLNQKRISKESFVSALQGITNILFCRKLKRLDIDPHLHMCSHCQSTPGIGGKFTYCGKCNYEKK